MTLGNPRELSLLWPGLSWSHISTAEPLASHSLSPGLGSCNWVKWGRGGEGEREDGWEWWKTFFMYPRGTMPCVVNTCEKKKQRCLAREKMMIRNWGLDSHVSHVFTRETIFSVYKQERGTQNHRERRLVSKDRNKCPQASLSGRMPSCRVLPYLVFKIQTTFTTFK